MALVVCTLWPSAVVKQGTCKYHALLIKLTPLHSPNHSFLLLYLHIRIWGVDCQLELHKAGDDEDFGLGQMPRWRLK